MRFTFLGTGTSAGVPVIGCDCAVCTSDDPRDRRLRTAASVSWTDPAGNPRTILLDAGPDLREQALTHNLTRCDGVFVTHNHVDHVWGIDELRRFNAVMKAPVDLFAEPRAMDELRRVYRHIFDKINNVNDSFVAHLIPRPLEPEVPVDLHGLRLTPFRLLHGRLPVLGFRLEATDPACAAPWLPLAYCTDVSGVPPESWRRFEGLSTLVLDALRFRHHPTHLTIDQALDIAQRVGADRTLFVHMAHDVAHTHTASLPDDIDLAHDGLTL